MPTGASSVGSGASRTSRVDDGASSVAGVDRRDDLRSAVDSVLARTSAIDLGASFVARIVDRGGLWIYEPPTALGQKVVLMFSTVLNLGAGQTVFLGAGGISTDENDVLLAMPAGTALELVVTSNVAPGAGSIVCTLRKEQVDTLVVVTLTGSGAANRKGSSAISTVFAAKDWLSMRLQSSGGAPAAIVNVALKYQFAT